MNREDFVKRVREELDNKRDRFVEGLDTLYSEQEQLSQPSLFDSDEYRQKDSREEKYRKIIQRIHAR